MTMKIKTTVIVAVACAVAALSTNAMADERGDNHRGGRSDDRRGGHSQNHNYNANHDRGGYDRGHNDHSYDDRRQYQNHHRQDRNEHFDRRHHNGYNYNGNWYYGPPPQNYYGNQGYNMGYHQWRRGDRLGYYHNRYEPVYYGQYRLRPPPRGYHWVRDDRGDFLLAAIATGIILEVILSNRY